MSLTAVSRCLECHAVVNVHWTACLVCKEPLPEVEGPRENLTKPISLDAVEAPKIPTAPLQAGWLVVYRNRRGVLCGGADDREHGTVQDCRWQGNGWIVLLTDGQQFPLSSIRAVGQTNEGRLVAAWTVREHGYDGRACQEALHLNK